MASKIKDICTEKFSPMIADLGYELVEVFYGKQVDGMNLIFYIDSPSGITLDDCEKVHRAIDPILDEMDPTAGASYILSVSSLGLDRPIKTERDFARNLGKEIELTLFAKLNGKKTFQGKLVDFSEGKVTIEVDGGNQEFELGKVAHIVPFIKF